MRSYLIVILAITLVGCTSLSTQSDHVGTTIEYAVLWDERLHNDESLTIDLTAALNNPAKYKKEGDFYSPKQNETAFGHRVIYIGLLGIGEMAGPNITVQGSPQDVSAYIAKKYDLDFEASPNKEAFKCELKKHIKLFVFKHPNLPNTSMVIGAYTGP